MPQTAKVLLASLAQLRQQQQISVHSQLILVDDGSHDQTWAVIRRLEAQNDNVFGVRFSRNFGHQNALLAGMQAADSLSDIVLTLDADLQDDPRLIPAMVACYRAGNDVVLGVRDDRQTDRWAKRWSAERFYGLLTKLGVPIVPNHADYRLLSHRALQALLQYHERNLFLRGIVPQLGFPTTRVYYHRQPRVAGHSKYTLKKMLALAQTGVLSFSNAPLRWILGTGVGLSVVSAVSLAVILGHDWWQGALSWNPLFSGLGVLSGLQLLGIGLVGAYVGQVLTEVQHRPRYVVAQNDVPNHRTVAVPATRVLQPSQKGQPF
ncbi:glycosyltransferase [Levilactobacillus acidifarinae DSM 19394]|uniref:Glycosyltransferase n=1 Tax=Levilactobacillus acidifarinae DSM 19394 = JCM 15949 TaxID=1423715 RepID=A0A0R1LSP4_9LACO|nr:glycosyltransferase [Levilactobacillus acidifarinae DSM 19394]